jgi:hypothetical protein
MLAICLLVGVVGGYALGYSDGKVQAQHESNLARMDALLNRIRQRNECMLKLIRGGKK